MRPNNRGVDQDIQPAPLGAGGFDDIDTLELVGYVGGDVDGLSAAGAEFGRQAADAVGVNVVQGHARARRRQRPGNRRAVGAGRAGDNGHLAG